MDRPITTRQAKVPETDQRGTFEALVSAYDVTYRVGGGREVIRRGAFRDAPDRLPIFWQHAMSGAPPIGVTDRVWETRDGLHVRGRLWVDDNDHARATWRALRAGALAEWSIGFRALDVRESGSTTEVLRGDLREVSTVLLGANPETETVAVRGNHRGRTRGHRPATRQRHPGSTRAKRRLRHAVSRAMVRLGTDDRDEAYWALYERSRAFRELSREAVGL